MTQDLAIRVGRIERETVKAVEAVYERINLERVMADEAFAQAQADHAVLAQEHRMLREAYIANERAGLTFRGRLRWLILGR